jgi:hypothetical protein
MQKSAASQFHRIPLNVPSGRSSGSSVTTLSR